MINMNKILLAGLLLGACGGNKGSGLKTGGDVPPPPNVTKSENTVPGKEEPKREISKAESNDYGAAAANFAANEKGGWNEQACRASADKFASVARSHPNLVEAQYMVGLSFHRCNLLEDAEKAYQTAIRLKPNHGMSLSNLGEIYYRAGKVDGARQYWDSAIKANGKLIAARNNMASLQLDQMRKINNPKDATWKKLEEDARFNLSNVLGVDTDNVKAYTLYGLIYMEGYQANKNRLDLAKLLLGEAEKRNGKYAPLQNALGLYHLHKGSLNDALKHFMAAVEADPKFVEARINVGLTTLDFRKYDTAKEQFGKAAELAPKNYDAVIGLGIAMRGLKDFDGAEAQYKKAAQLDPKRGDAYYNLGVLYASFRANKAEFKAQPGVYQQGKEFFQQFLQKTGDPTDVAEAKTQIATIDKTITLIQATIKAQANQPPPPAAPAAPATPPATPPAAPADKK
jgi:tetratricopeptide (TPR) repeat protein